MTVANMAAQGCCCGPGVDCSIGSDDFGRADEASVAGWTETDFAIVSNELSTSTSDAIAIFDTAHPDGDSTGVASVSFIGNATDEVQVLIDVVDANNFHFAQIEFPASGTTGCLYLYSRSGGTDTELTKINASVTSGGTTSMAVYLSPDNQLSVKINGSVSANLCYDVTPHGGTKAGVGTGTISGTVTFDNFTFYRHSETGTYEDCPSADCSDGGCGLGSDDFSGSVLGCQWTSSAGTSTLGSGELAQGASALLLFNRVHNDASVRIETRVKGANNDVAWIAVNHDGATHCYAQLIFGTGKTLKLFDSAGVELTSLPCTTAVNTFLDFDACFGNGSFSATAGGVFVGAGVATPGTPAKFGIGTGGTAAAVVWDSFYAEIPDGSGGSLFCEYCPMPCDACIDGDARGPMMLTPSGIIDYGCGTGDCPDLNDAFILDWIGGCTWYHELDTPLCGHMGDYSIVAIRAVLSRTLLLSGPFTGSYRYQITIEFLSVDGDTQKGIVVLYYYDYPLDVGSPSERIDDPFDCLAETITDDFDGWFNGFLPDNPACIFDNPQVDGSKPPTAGLILEFLGP